MFLETPLGDLGLWWLGFGFGSKSGRGEVMELWTTFRHSGHCIPPLGDIGRENIGDGDEDDGDDEDDGGGGGAMDEDATQLD